ncbi:MAG: hypothetical protein PWQ51_1811 [Methanolobus sp.]|jgi:hypothetical protein|nr:hypothetical protein [Methanolobus sp.]
MLDDEMNNVHVDISNSKIINMLQIEISVDGCHIAEMHADEVEINHEDKRILLIVNNIHNFISVNVCCMSYDTLKDSRTAK